MMKDNFQVQARNTWTKESWWVLIISIWGGGLYILRNNLLVEDFSTPVATALAFCGYF